MSALAETHAALLQAIVTLGTAALCWFLFARYRHTYFLWWSAAWSLYVLRIAAIIAFLATGRSWWLFVHQVLTGWTALALLWAALSYSRAADWRPWYVIAIAFPVVWSYVAIHQLQSFMLAAIPAVLFLSAATLWTAWIFISQYRSTRSFGAATLGGVLAVWGVHHLDYPILRAQGAWNPWGYYVDILFVLATGIGIVILGLEELDRVSLTVAQRTVELERLSSRMLRQHEEERHRLSLELHDQTAQVWAAAKMQLGLLKEGTPAHLSARLDRALDLVDAGIQSIRSVTTNLRPPLLDDLGLMPALRALVESFREQSGLRITLEAPSDNPAVSSEAALAVFRSLQEALSNVARHSGATSAEVRVYTRDGKLTLSVRDNGCGFKSSGTVQERGSGTLGLAGMRERVSALRGSVTLDSGAGACVTVSIPLSHVG